eukprot:ANDGO_08259.mRNA.1 hypothetical protein NAEGRDRAFT_78855
MSSSDLEVQKIDIRVRSELSYLDTFSLEWASFFMDAARLYAARRNLYFLSKLLDLFFDSWIAYNESATGDEDHLWQMSVLGGHLLEEYASFVLQWPTDVAVSSSSGGGLDLLSGVIEKLTILSDRLCVIIPLRPYFLLMKARVMAHQAFNAADTVVEDVVAIIIDVLQNRLDEDLNDTQLRLEYSCIAVSDLCILASGRSPLTLCSASSTTRPVSSRRFSTVVLPTSASPHNSASYGSFSESSETSEEVADFLVAQALEYFSNSRWAQEENRLRFLRDSLPLLPSGICRARVAFVLSLCAPTSASSESYIFESTVLCHILSVDAAVEERNREFSFSPNADSGKTFSFQGRSSVYSKLDCGVDFDVPTFSPLVPFRFLTAPLYSPSFLSGILPLFCKVLMSFGDKYVYASALYESVLIMRAQLFGSRLSFPSTPSPTNSVVSVDPFLPVPDLSSVTDLETVNLMRTLAMTAYEHHDSRLALEYFCRLLAYAISKSLMAECLFFSQLASDIAFKRGEFSIALDCLRSALACLMPEVPVSLFRTTDSVFRLDTAMSQLHITLADVLFHSFDGCEKGIDHLKRLLKCEIPKAKRLAAHLKLAGFYVSRRWFAIAGRVLEDAFDSTLVVDDSFCRCLFDFEKGRGNFGRAFSWCLFALSNCAPSSSHSATAIWHLRAGQCLLQFRSTSEFDSLSFYDKQIFDRSCMNFILEQEPLFANVLSFPDSRTTVVKVAIKHFRRSYDLFRAVGDDLKVAKAVMFIARAQLECVLDDVIFTGYSIESAVERLESGFSFRLSVPDLEEPCVLALRVGADTLAYPLYPLSLLLMSECRYVQRRYRSSLRFLLVCKSFVQRIFFSTSGVYSMSNSLPSFHEKLKSIYDRLIRSILGLVSVFGNGIVAFLNFSLVLDEYSLIEAALHSSRRKLSGEAPSDFGPSAAAAAAHRRTASNVSNVSSTSSEVFDDENTDSDSSSIHSNNYKPTLRRFRTLPERFAPVKNSLDEMKPDENVNAANDLQIRVRERLWSVFQRMRAYCHDFSAGYIEKVELRRKLDSAYARLISWISEPDQHQSSRTEFLDSSHSVSRKLLPLQEIFRSPDTDRSVVASPVPRLPPRSLFAVLLNDNLCFISMTPEFAFRRYRVSVDVCNKLQWSFSDFSFSAVIPAPFPEFLLNLLLQGREDRIPRDDGGVEWGVPHPTALLSSLLGIPLQSLVCDEFWSSVFGLETTEFPIVSLSKFPWKLLPSLFASWKSSHTTPISFICLSRSLHLFPWESVFACSVVRFLELTAMRVFDASADSLPAGSIPRGSKIGYSTDAFSSTEGTTSSRASTSVSSATVSTTHSSDTIISNLSSTSSSSDSEASRRMMPSVCFLTFVFDAEDARFRAASDMKLKSSLIHGDVSGLKVVPYMNSLVKPGKGLSAYRKKYRLLRFELVDRNFRSAKMYANASGSDVCIVLCSFADWVDLCPLLASLVQRPPFSLWFVPDARLKDVMVFVHRMADILDSNVLMDVDKLLFCHHVLLKRLGIPSILLPNISLLEKMQS